MDCALELILGNLRNRPDRPSFGPRPRLTLPVNGDAHVAQDHVP
jgi:hypothetical protein